MLRMARRRAGLSQRAMAARAGVGITTLAAAESGKQEPSLRVVYAVLSVAGLELTVAAPPPPPCRHVLAYLSWSLSARLHMSVGGSGWPKYDRDLPVWRQLQQLSAAGTIFLTGPPAVGLWLPGLLHEAPLPIGLADAHGVPPPPSPTPDLAVRVAERPVDCTVSIPLVPRCLWTPPPAALALRPDCAPWQRALRAVATVLDGNGARDAAGRRVAAHREPARDDETGRLLYARRWSRSLLPPDAVDGRGWRLNDDAGMRAWIEHRGRRG